jgi:hypothetical protein
MISELKAINRSTLKIGLNLLMVNIPFVGTNFKVACFLVSTFIKMTNG